MTEERELSVIIPLTSPTLQERAIFYKKTEARETKKVFESEKVQVKR